MERSRKSEDLFNYFVEVAGAAAAFSDAGVKPGPGRTLADTGGDCVHCVHWWILVYTVVYSPR